MAQLKSTNVAGNLSVLGNTLASKFIKHGGTADELLLADGTTTSLATIMGNINAAITLKGSLGTGGTVTSLGAPGVDTLGHGYKVITAGTYDNKTAKIGDMFVCYKTKSNTYEWMHIPSGDDIEDTKNTAGSTQLASNKLFLIGAKSQDDNPQTYSNANIFIDASGNLVVNGGKFSGTATQADSATKLTTARTIRTNLGSTSTASFDGTASITPGVTGTLPVANGGTGAATFTSGQALIGNGTGAVTTRAITNNTSKTAVTASTNLVTANTLYYHSGNSNITTVGTITSGTWNGTIIAIDKGGTGGSDAATARANLNVPTRTGENASGTWGISVSGSAAYPKGFNANGGNITWGTLAGDTTTTTGYRTIARWNSSNGGSVAFADGPMNNSTKAGQTSMQINGYFYQEEGNYQVLDNRYMSNMTQSVNGTTSATGLVKINTRLVVKGNGGSYNEGIRIVPADNGWSNIYFSDNKDETNHYGTGTNGWLLGRRGTAGSNTTAAVGDFTIECNNSDGRGLTLKSNGDAYIYGKNFSLGNTKVVLQYDSTNECLNFVFN